MNKLTNLIEQLCPDGVEYKRIGEIADTNIGLATSVTKHKATKGVLLLHNSDIQPNKIVIKKFEYITEDFAKKNEKKILHKGDIITVHTGDVGTSAVISDEHDGAIGFTTITARIKDKDLVLPEYLSSFLNSQLCKNQIASMTISDRNNLNQSSYEKILMPVPPLEVQAEIVRILDNFTELTTELTTKLTTELTNRKKQYEYYRDSLLSDNNDLYAEVKTVGEISKFRRGSFPQPYGNKEWYDGEGAMPFVQVADIGDDMHLVENTKRKISKLAQPKSVFAPKGSIIISLQGSIGRIAVTQYDAYIDRTVAIFSDISDKLLPKYFVYQLQRIFSIKEKTARGSTIKTITKEEFTSFPIPILPLVEQQRIVNILDRFDKLCNDISEGLPAEIEARQKQYEYYRDKLLTFKETTKH